MKQEILKIKEINVMYAHLLGELVEFQHGEDSEKQTPKEKRLRELNKNIIALNGNIKEELQQYQKREQQLERLEKYLEANRFATLADLIGRFEKQGTDRLIVESIIHSQKLQLMDQEATIKRLNEMIEDHTEVSGLKKTIRKQQEQVHNIQLRTKNWRRSAPS